MINNRVLAIITTAIVFGQPLLADELSEVKNRLETMEEVFQ